MKRIGSLMILVVVLVALGNLVAREALAAPSGATITVNSPLDEPLPPATGQCLSTPSGKCTLRAAIMLANRVASPGVTIVVPSGIYTLTILPLIGDDGDAFGDLNITRTMPIMITGAGAANTIIDANQIDRVFSIAANCTVSISGVTIRNGLVSPGSGGGIHNNGMLTLNNSALSGNKASTEGGGMFNAGTATLNNSTLSVSSAPYGGGIFNTFGTATLNNSTLSGNSASNGGGIYNENGALTLNTSTLSGNPASNGGGIFNAGTARLNNSTLSGNSASIDGGGIYNGSTLFLVNSTLSQNNAVGNGGGLGNHQGTANVYNTSVLFNGADADPTSSGSGGGVYNDDANGAIFNLRNTLVAGNYSSNTRTDDDCTGTVHSYGRNLFGTLTPCTVITEGGGTWYSLNSINLIGPLRNNGGPTLTHALLAGSNAIDWGDPVYGCVDQNSVLLATDQRGAARVVGVACDIGAYEYRPPLYLPLVVR